MTCAHAKKEGVMTEKPPCRLFSLFSRGSSVCLGECENAQAELRQDGDNRGQNVQLRSSSDGKNEKLQDNMSTRGWESSPEKCECGNIELKRVSAKKESWHSVTGSVR